MNPLLEQEQVNETRASDFSFKVVLVGDTGVGKSILLKRLLDENSSIENDESISHQRAFETRSGPTVGVDFQSMVFNLERSQIRVGLNFFDTSGAEIYRSIAKSYFYNVQAFILAYDVNDMNSFLNCKNWLDEIASVHSTLSHHNTISCSTDLIKILVGCKSDLTGGETQKAAVSSKKARKFAKQNGFVLFFETSAKNNLNIKELFEEMCLELISNYIKFLNYQQSFIEFLSRPCTDKSPLVPASVYAISSTSDVYFNCQTESQNFNHIIMNSINAKRKNLQTEGNNFFDFSFFD